jgi:hypothetical protein
MKSLVEIELAELSIDIDFMRRTKLARVPTWDELFESIHSVVQIQCAGLYQKGEVVLDYTSDWSSGGRCFLYAALTWACLQLLFKRGSGVNIGGIAIKMFDEMKGEGALALPRDPKNPNTSGGYHAWCVLERNLGVQHPTHDDVLVLDFSYHWFKSAVGETQTIAGPDLFLVASPGMLQHGGIVYHANDKATDFVTSTLDLADYREEVLKILEKLKAHIGVI